MKSLFFIMFIIPVLGLVKPNMGEITSAISKGDVKTLSTYFDESVEVAILDDEDIYDKPEAIAVVDKFFKSNTPKSFSQVHKGTSKGSDSHYVIGDLIAGKTTYRVYLYMKESSGKYLIQELRFDKE